MTVQVPFKRGDTFLIEAEVKIDGVVRDITGWVVKVQVRKGATLIAELDIEYTDRVNGLYRLRKDVTTDWGLGELSCDIQYTTDALQIISTETFIIACEADITLP